MPDAYQVALGFDFGLARIGVAVGSLEVATARGLEVVANRDGAVDWPEIDRLIQTWRPSVLVVGEPEAQTGAGGRLPRALRRFCTELVARYALPVARINEDYSSECARAELRAQRQEGARKRPARGETDKMAAAYILNAWLSEQDVVARKS